MPGVQFSRSTVLLIKENSRRSTRRAFNDYLRLLHSKSLRLTLTLLTAFYRRHSMSVRKVEQTTNRNIDLVAKWKSETIVSRNEDPEDDTYGSQRSKQDCASARQL